jgi:hypothetical protein
MRSRAGGWLDLGPALVFTAVGLVITLQPDNGDGTVVDTLLMPAATLPVIWWRRAPLGAAIAIAVGMVISGAPTFDQVRCGFAIPGAMLILFSVAAREERRRALLGLVAIELGVASLLFTDSVLDITEGPFVPGALFPLVLCAAVWGAGRLFRSRARMVAELADRTAALERAREQTAQLAAESERIRLAGVLDVAVRDRLRAIVELAAARDGPSATFDDARATFEWIEREGRDSLHRMRQLLGLLHG